MPKRIQRQRTKGYRLPPNAVYVGRPTKWGNPFRVGERLDTNPSVVVGNRAHAVALFRAHCGWLTGTSDDSSRAAEELRGKDLVCWCPLEDADGNPVPCHADVLLEWANREEQGE